MTSLPSSPDELQQKIRPLLEAEMRKLLDEAEKSPVAYTDNFLYTFDPKRPPHHLRFRPFEFQKDFMMEIKASIENGKDIFIEKSREMGATYSVLAVFLWFWRYVPGSNFLLGSRKESYVDNRGAVGEDELSNKEESLFGKLDYMVSKMPAALLPEGFDKEKHMPYMTLRNPENGNVISGESSNANFSRGGRHKAILLDEFAFWENDTGAWGSTADTTNCRIVLTTPGIKPNTKAKRLRYGEDGETIKVLSFHARLDPRKDEDYFSYEKSRRSTEDYAREIDINWESAIKGRVYDEIKNAKIGSYPFIPNRPLFVSWDFGYDGTAIGFWNINTLGLPRIFQSFLRANRPIQFFMPLFGHPIDSTFFYTDEELEVIESVKNLPPAIHYGDPDVEKRSYQSADTVSTRKVLESFGIFIQTKPESNRFYIRREKTKLLLSKGIEVNDTKENKFFLDSIKSSVYPERSEGSQATSAIVKPVHNWASHHRTQLEYFSVNYDPTYFVEEVEEPSWAKTTPSWSKK